jgi:hypothetical protein
MCCFFLLDCRVCYQFSNIGVGYVHISLEKENTRKKQNQIIPSKVCRGERGYIKRKLHGAKQNTSTF